METEISRPKPFPAVLNHDKYRAPLQKSSLGQKSTIQESQAGIFEENNTTGFQQDSSKHAQECPNRHPQACTCPCPLIALAFKSVNTLICFCKPLTWSRLACSRRWCCSWCRRVSIISWIAVIQVPLHWGVRFELHASPCCSVVLKRATKGGCGC